MHEDRQSVDQQGGAKPTKYSVLDLDISYKHSFNRLSVEGKLTTSRLDYENVDLVTGTRRNNQDRDRWDYNPSLHLVYEVHPQYDVFTSIRYTKVEFDKELDRHSQRRSSQGGDMVVGVNFGATDMITSDVAIGYIYRDFDDANLAAIKSITGWLSFNWSVTPLTTIYSKLTQDIGETTLEDVSGSNITVARLGVEHELLRSLLLKLDGGYSYIQYEGFDSSEFKNERIEDRYFASFTGKYIFSSLLYMDFSYKFSARDSNRSLNDFDQNRFFLNFVLKM